MAQSFFPITPTNVAPTNDDTWRDVDVSASVPSGATGVVLHINKRSGFSSDVGVRKNGSTDARLGSIYGKGHFWTAVGVDASRIFEAVIQSGSGGTFVDIWLVGYTMTGVTFFTNAYDKSLTATAAWTDIDCSVEAPSATGLIFEQYRTSGVRNYGMRKNGSTDNRYNYDGSISIGIIIGCDAGQIVEGEIEDTTADFFLRGYITDGALFNTNATDISLATIDAWTDLSALPAHSAMGFIEATSSLSDRLYGLRKNGSAEDIYANGYITRHPWAFVECDNSGVIEGKISDAVVDFFVVGYALKVAYSIGLTANITTQACSSIADTTATGNGTLVDLGSTAVTEHGHCWNTSSNPTTANSKTTKGTGALGSFTSSITGLVKGFKYYVRAYATNSGGTAYGGNVSFVAGESWSQLEAGNLKVKGTTIRYIGFDGVEYYIQGVAV